MVDKKYKRNCPVCDKEIFHSRLNDRNQADKKQTPCRTCSFSLGYSKDKKFSRNCPVCGKEVKHNTERQCIKSKDKPCSSCAKKDLWAQENSPLRKEETRLKRNQSISLRRQDLNSAYNTIEYQEKKSQAMKIAWQTSEVLNSQDYRDKQSQILKEVWQTSEYRDKRLSEETLASFSEKMSKSWEENYEKFLIALKLGWQSTERKNAARERLLLNLANEEFRNKFWSKKIRKVSKLELKIKFQLEALGFIHSSEHNKHISRYLPDFLNEKEKIIIEIYGDYWHCNPYLKDKPYSNSSWFHPKLKMTSEEKWAADDLRVKFLISNGYKVIILWENDIKNNNYNIELLLKNMNYKDNILS